MNQVEQAWAECFDEQRPLCLFNHPLFPSQRITLFEQAPQVAPLWPVKIAPLENQWFS